MQDFVNPATVKLLSVISFFFQNTIFPISASQNRSFLKKYLIFNELMCTNTIGQNFKAHQEMKVCAIMAIIFTVRGT